MGNYPLWYSIGLVLGGVALFIYGIDLMSDGLKMLAGSKIRTYIEKYTNSTWKAILVGTVITAMLQSSTAVTVISISLVRAGMMKLEQAIGITIGANIGTCITSIMIGMDIEQFAYYIVFIGIVVMFLMKKKQHKLIGQVVLGFGLLFTGLGLMADELVLIKDQAWFVGSMEFMGQYPWVALIGGTIVTALMQSSSAVIGIVQILYSTGVIAPAAAVAFIYGSNVGTTLTAIVVGAGGSVASKRAAMFHVVYNIAGALLGMVLLTPFIKLVDLTTIGGGAEMWVAQAHLMFNVLSTILVVPFVRQCVKILEKLIPGEEQKGIHIEKVDDLDYDLINTLPVAALEVAKVNVSRMGRVVLENVRLSQRYLDTKNEEDFDEVMEVEEVVNNYDTKLTHYLTKIAQRANLSKSQSKEYSKNFQVVKNLERMSDLTTNLVEFYKMAYDEKEAFSEEAVTELKKMYSKIESMVPKAMEIFKNGTDEEYQSLCDEEDILNLYEYESREMHFERICNIDSIEKIASSVYADILSNLERLGDHCLNIARVTLFGAVYHEEKAKMLSHQVTPDELRHAIEEKLEEV